MKRELIITKDGSHTLFVPEINEYYHSIFGAIQESKHVFIKEGLNYCKQKNITVFEIGFGTGLNALLTFMELSKYDIQLCYYTIENYPLNIKTIKLLNYPDLLKLNDKEKAIFYMVHNAKWDREIILNENFRFTKIKNDLTEYYISFLYDVVYFDAFAPDKQPEIWSRDVFQKIYNNLNQNGILTTYCAKGEVKRLLRSIGFFVESIPGPRGKREMIRARKS